MSEAADAPTFDTSCRTPREIASIIFSDLTGAELVDALLTHFPRATRFEFAAGFASAVALLKADVAVAEIENRILREEVGRLRGVAA
jgi:hypothetical protein